MDSRDYQKARGKWYKALNEKGMTITVEIFNDDGDEIEVELPFKYEVCELCGGTAKHLNPNIDLNGLTSEDFEDSDFAESYFSGRYDEICRECNGVRVSPQINEDVLTPEQKEMWEKFQEQEFCRACDIRTENAERRAERGY